MKPRIMNREYMGKHCNGSERVNRHLHLSLCLQTENCKLEDLFDGKTRPSRAQGTECRP